MKKKLIILFLIIIFALFSIFIYKKNQEKMFSLPVDSKNDTKISIEIEDGMTINEIGELLFENDLIRNTKYFQKFLKNNNLQNLKSGYYELSKSQSLLEISKILNKGARPIGIKVTFPEGYTCYQFAKLLEEKKIITSSEEFLKSIKNADTFYEKHPFLKQNDIKILEGYLYPDTYFFEENTSSSDIINEMLFRFEDVLANNEIVNNLPKNMSLNNIITLASIVQKEASNIDEMPIIAGVFYNRLNINMPLQSCVTVEYEIGRELTPKERLSAEDIRKESLYNTYVNTGLPPTPISSVSLDSIKAAINPESTNFFYFVADRNGKTHFSRTYEEHLNKIKEIYGEY